MPSPLVVLRNDMDLLQTAAYYALIAILAFAPWLEDFDKKSKSAMLALIDAAVVVATRQKRALAGIWSVAVFYTSLAFFPGACDIYDVSLTKLSAMQVLQDSWVPYTARSFLYWPLETNLLFHLMPPHPLIYVFVIFAYLSRKAQHSVSIRYHISNLLDRLFSSFPGWPLYFGVLSIGLLIFSTSYACRGQFIEGLTWIEPIVREIAFRIGTNALKQNITYECMIKDSRTVVVERLPWYMTSTRPYFSYMYVFLLSIALLWIEEMTIYIPDIIYIVEYGVRILLIRVRAIPGSWASRLHALNWHELRWNLSRSSSFPWFKTIMMN